jgi:carbon monoxide dehydrogenase subunit G
MPGTRLRNTFTVAASVDRAWELLTDIERVARCVPGAELTETVDERTYRGRIAVRLGPVALTFAGTLRFAELDPAARRAVINAVGTETRGRGAAEAAVIGTLEPIEAGTRVDLESTLTLSGTVAQYGRATAMIAAVAQQLIDQFAAALEADMKAAAPPSVFAPSEIAGLRLIWRAITAAIGRRFGAAKRRSGAKKPESDD